MAGRKTVVGLIIAASILLSIVGVYFLTSRGEEEKRFYLIADEFGYNQSEGGPQLRVRAGEKVTITLMNQGEEEHELMIVTKETLAFALDPTIAQKGEAGLEDALGGAPKPVFAGAMIHDVEAGETGSTTFVADRPGEYVYGCFADAPDGIVHAFRSMWGEFVVEP
jgi:FtsP/CotA-like multicopper oxidase with cupredoxin domain